MDFLECRELRFLFWSHFRVSVSYKVGIV